MSGEDAEAIGDFWHESILMRTQGLDLGWNDSETKIFIFILEKSVKWSQYGDNLPVHDDLLIMIFYGAGTKDMDIFSVILCDMGSWKGKLIQIYILNIHECTPDVFVENEFR